MLLPKFDFHEPATLNEAIDILLHLGSGAKLIAGGTDLLPNMKKRVLSPAHLVSLERIDELNHLDVSNGRIHLGAGLTVSELAQSETLKKNLGAFTKGAGSLGSPLIRNRATLAGNLITARPAADLPPSLMVYGASVVLKRPGNERTVPLKNFFTGPGETVINADEILSGVHLPAPPPHTGADYIKLGVREALSIALVNAAAFLSLTAPDGTIEKARIVLGAVAPTPLRAVSAEKILLGEKPSPALFEKAAREAVKDCRPIDDFRGSAEYRTAMVEVLTRRTLAAAHETACLS